MTLVSFNRDYGTKLQPPAVETARKMTANRIGKVAQVSTQAIIGVCQPIDCLLHRCLNINPHSFVRTNKVFVP